MAANTDTSRATPAVTNTISNAVANADVKVRQEVRLKPYATNGTSTSDVAALAPPPLDVESIALGALAPPPSLEIEQLEPIAPIAITPLEEGASGPSEAPEGSPAEPGRRVSASEGSLEPGSWGWGPTSKKERFPRAEEGDRP